MTQELQESKARMSLATLGPWYAKYSKTWGWCVRTSELQYRRASDGAEEDTYIASRLRSKADAELIAAAYSSRELPKEVAGLLEAAKACHLWLTQLADAWSRGVFTEHDGKGGLRSNTNQELAKCLEAVIAAYEEVIRRTAKQPLP